MFKFLKRSWINRKRKGSFLLEVLLALIILSGSLSLIIQAITSSLRAVSYASEYLTASFLADNKINNILFSQDILQDGLEHIKVDEKEYALTWDRQDGPSTAGEMLKKIDFNISWKSGRKNNQIPFELFYLGANE